VILNIVISELKRTENKKFLVLALNETLKEQLYGQLKLYIHKRVNIACEGELGEDEYFAVICDEGNKFFELNIVKFNSKKELIGAKKLSRAAKIYVLTATSTRF
jgi:hypothetical protein